MLALESASRPDNAEALAAELASVAETLATTAQDARPTRRHETLSGDEQRVAAVVLVSDCGTRDELRSAALRELLAEHGARAERMADGTTKIAFIGKSTPLDQATQACPTISATSFWSSLRSSGDSGPLRARG